MPRNHEVVIMQLNGIPVEIDAGVATVVKMFNDKGYKTHMCCEGHFSNPVMMLDFDEETHEEFWVDTGLVQNLAPFISFTVSNTKQALSNVINLAHAVSLISELNGAKSAIIVKSKYSRQKLDSLNEMQYEAWKANVLRRFQALAEYLPDLNS